MSLAWISSVATAQAIEDLAENQARSGPFQAENFAVDMCYGSENLAS